MSGFAGLAHASATDRRRQKRTQKNSGVAEWADDSPIRREHCPYGARKISRTLSRTGAVQDIKFHLHTLIQQRQNSQPPNP
nr:MAG: hypothetical protein EDM05_13495 [Leptolyngbya sp. IPPAS B-1204]